ncbi:hypothetical protein [Echinicola shivajiensis]|uniref:hypothetical protein n=1 Tax=Echinicola shivajiensis TaxID=1035916 RepID=UPI001BFCC137|nr:hypothetical protein [Echinicola shivajiensis]
MKKLYSYHHLKWVSTLLIFLFSIPSLLGQSFTEDFEVPIVGSPSSFSKTIAGVQFNFVFTNAGDHGRFLSYNLGESHNPAAVSVESNTYIPYTQEVVTISRDDGLPFECTSLFIRNSGGTNVQIQGSLAGTCVGSPNLLLKKFHQGIFSSLLKSKYS